MLPIFLLLAPAAAPPAGVSFDRDVAPILRAHCLKCHAGPRVRGDLALTSRERLLAGGTHGPAVVPGNALESLLFKHVRDGKMPPRNPLATKEIELLRRWIDAGAGWSGELRPIAVADGGRAGPDWWSLQPIRRPAVPESSQVRTPIDAFLLAKLAEKGLSFSPEADRRTLIRRVTFDLIGLPPTPEEIAAFENDPRPDAYERLVDRLLASPHHGERWCRHWLDVVRFAESHGYEMNTLRPNAWPYRDWVIRAFNRDTPYNQFIREQFAGDILDKEDPLTAAATGFLVAGPHDLVGNSTLEGRLQQRADDLSDMVATTGATFLGMTVGCARCHDHKFDPIQQREFYALQTLLSGVDHAERSLRGFAPGRKKQGDQLRETIARLDRQLEEQEPVIDGKTRRPGVDIRRNVERFRPVKARFVRFVINATIDGSEPCLDEVEVHGPDEVGNLALASRGVKVTASSLLPGHPIHQIKHVNDGRGGNSFSWISNERGKGWVRLELPRPSSIDRIAWGRDAEGKFRDRLASSYRIEASLDGKDWQTVASSADRLAPGQKLPAVGKLRAERDRLLSQLRSLQTPVSVYSGTFRAPDVIHRLHRGDVMQKREVANPGALAVLQPELKVSAEASESQRRLALADWLAHPDNPLPARVMVNRVWHWHFGQGIVRTPSDFGYNGDRPSHPELLDWLAAEFRDSGGQLKPLHRLIVLSAAYRQSSRHDAKAVALDAGNRLLWRANPRRLEAEAIRDGMLQVSGELDTRMGGPGYHLWDYSGYVINFTPRPKLGPETFRRMVYQFKPRLQQDGTFGAFDCPDATATAPKRNVSTTALQALNLLNDPFVLERAERFADRVREAGSESHQQVERAFRLALGRMPSRTEAQAAEVLVSRHGLVALCRALFNANEFVFVH